MLASKDEFKDGAAEPQATLKKFTKLLRTTYGDNIELITLFGSAARNELTDDSDIDILIVVKNSSLNLRKDIIGIATDILLQYGYYISVKLYDKKQYEYLNNLQTPFMKNIALEGKILWKYHQKKKSKCC